MSTVTLDLGDLDPRRIVGHLRTCSDCRHSTERWCHTIADAIEAQTRPAIEEPTGLGAVVEDEDEACWVRADDLKRPWHWGDNRRAWADLRPVRVLSEGWSE